MVTKKMSGLGRGLAALIPENFDPSLLVDEQERVQKLFISDIVPAKSQPRTTFDQQALEELASSIKRHGLLQPIVVTPQNGGFSIVAGERRWRAAQIAGLKQLPALVRTVEELERLEIALVENVQRVDLSPLEQAASIQRLRDQFNIDIADIAGRLGKAQTTIVNIVRLLGLPPAAQQALHQKSITEGHARAILAVKDPAKQQELLELIIKNGWTVRQAEQYAIAQKKGGQLRKKATERAANNTTPETNKLGSYLKTTVSLRRLAKGGKLEIGFKNETDLKRIIKKISN